MATPKREAMETEPDSRIRFRIEPDLSALAPAAERVRVFLLRHGVDRTALFAVEMAIEEIATNAIKYAFRSYSGGEITIEAAAMPGRAELIIEDNGDAFDPTTAPDPEVNRALEDMPIGGLGIHLVRELTDGFEYHRVDDRNKIRVWVKCET
jgi:serine/threonine-protein kinase RsbW